MNRRTVDWRPHAAAEAGAMIELDIAQADAIGTRAEQQDAACSVALGTGDGTSLLVLADGLGGHADGALAAKIVIEAFRDAAESGRFDHAAAHAQALHGALEDINARILAAADPADDRRGMASTAVAAIVTDGAVRWISVGDSHLYVCRGGRLSKLNADHSQAGMMIRDGYAPTDEAVLSVRSVLVSALTGREIEEIDAPAHDVALEVGDVLLLASDGLNTLSDQEIAFAIDRSYESGAEAICTALLGKVTDRKLARQDNTTVLVARVLGTAPRTAPHPNGPTLRLDQAALPSSAPVSGQPGRRLPLKILLLAMAAAAAASVIVTQTM